MGSYIFSSKHGVFHYLRSLLKHEENIVSIDKCLKWNISIKIKTAKKMELDFKIDKQNQSEFAG